MGRVFVLARHGQSTLNVERRVNGDPSVPVEVTPVGEEEASRLAAELAGLPLELCVHTRFGRTRRTAEIALAGRAIPAEVEPLLDDVDVGDLEGKSIDEYQAWKTGRARSEPFPGGESLDDAARRYAAGFRRLLSHDASHVLVITHEIPIRYALNGLAGSGSLDSPASAIPNAVPYLFDDAALKEAAARIEALAGPA